MKENDIYRWQYKEGVQIPITGCTSNIGVFRSGVLSDTFWGVGYSDGRKFSEDDAIRDLNLRLIGNFDDLIPLSGFNTKYYDPNDVVDINHSNSTQGNCYIKIGSRRCRKTMIKLATDRIADFERNLEHIQKQIESTKAELEKINTGADVDSVWIYD